MYEKILIVDDEEGIISFVKDALITEGYDVLVATNGDEAVEMAKKQPDLILLDIMMPGKDGYEVCKLIRDQVICPIIFLSALQSETDKIKGLTIGGDDYLTKPFSIRELKSRIQAHLRRDKRLTNPQLKPSMGLRFGRLTIYIKERSVFCDDKEITFTKREFDIIEFLALHAGMVYSKEQIYENIWGYDAEGDSIGIAEHIKKIRAKISQFDQKTSYITTVWGVGYKWEKQR